MCLDFPFHPHLHSPHRGIYSVFSMNDSVLDATRFRFLSITPFQMYLPKWHVMDNPCLPYLLSNHDSPLSASMQKIILPFFCCLFDSPRIIYFEIHMPGKSTLVGDQPLLTGIWQIPLAEATSSSPSSRSNRQSSSPSTVFLNANTSKAHCGQLVIGVMRLPKGESHPRSIDYSRRMCRKAYDHIDPSTFGIGTFFADVEAYISRISSLHFIP